jgi:hypothetical protein
LLGGATTAAAEVQVRFAPTEAPAYGVVVRCAPDGTEGTEILYHRGSGRLGSAPLDLADGEGLVLRMYIDHSVVEAFANGRACHTVRCYPGRDDALGIGLIARGGSVQALVVDVWELQRSRR